VPTPLSIEQVGVGDGVFAYVHVNVMFVATPCVTVVGVAEKLAMLGAAGGCVPVIVTLRVELPTEFVQVSVNVVVPLSVTIDWPPFVTGPTP
jgi:hypothetical protein